MKIYLKGHDYKYALEQMLLTMFPSERPEYPQRPEPGDWMTVSLSKGPVYTTAFCTLSLGDSRYRGSARIKTELLQGELITDRYCQRLIKNSIYRAALASGLKRPPWGALTGVRPGKLLCALMSSGLSEEEAVKKFIRDYDVTPERAELCLQTARVTLRETAALEEKDICLYVGIPFCPTRCSYCSFVSQSVEKSMKLIAPFLEALLTEVRETAAVINSLGLRVVSVYMGGGTPTTLSAAQLDTLLAALEREFDLSHIREYTVEAGRPDTITEDKLTVLKKHGVDRVSVNPQSMSDSVLEAIGRKHTAGDIIAALNKVRAEGGFAVNMDLIAGLPTDTAEAFSRTLDTVISLKPENITVHTLSLKKGSGITLAGTALPEAAEVGRMLDDAKEKLGEAGYAPYYLYRQKFMSGGFENVGWAKPGYENLYNVCIMEELCSIIAMGGGGSTKLIRPGDARNIRIMEPKYPLEYINSIEKTCLDKGRIAEFYNE